MTAAAPSTAAAAQRPGVALTEDLVRRKCEHNEGMLSTLEEIALHQLDIDRIEVLNNCRHLKIVLLQSNLISKIENLHRLKRLEYVNLAINNIVRIENLDRCESLNKLDLTVNFIDLDELQTVESLKNNLELRTLYLTGNPCMTGPTAWDGCRDYVVATLPQLTELDGTAITRSERIKAVQRLPELQEELARLAPQARERKYFTQRAREVREAEKDRRRAAGEIGSDDDDTDEWCPEVRIRDQREMREQNEAKEEARAKAKRDDFMFGDQPERERRLFKEDGTPTQMNTAKWPFSIEDDGTHVRVDVALPKHMDSAQIDADVQPTYVCIKAKKNILQLILPAEVLTDASTAARSATTGHLVLTCPKLHPIVTSKAPEPRKKDAKPLPAPAPPKLLGPGGALKGAVDVRHIVRGAEKGEAPQLKKALGPEWDDEEEVPPLL